MSSETVASWQSEHLASRRISGGGSGGSNAPCPARPRTSSTVVEFERDRFDEEEAADVALELAAVSPEELDCLLRARKARPPRTPAATAAAATTVARDGAFADSGMIFLCPINLLMEGEEV